MEGAQGWRDAVEKSDGQWEHRNRGTREGSCPLGRGDSSHHAPGPTHKPFLYYHVCCKSSVRPQPTRARRLAPPSTLTIATSCLDKDSSCVFLWMARGKGFGLFSSVMWLQPLALCGHVQEWHGHPRHSTSRTVNTKTMVPFGRREKTCKNLPSRCLETTKAHC